MIKYLKSIWDKIKSLSLIKKILLIFITIIYIGIVCISLITVNVDSTSPGSVTRVNNVVKINSENTQGSIYTVSVYTENKVSILGYWLRKLDNNTSITLGESTTYQVYTDNEEYLSNVGYKEQSIQDSIILAYTTAMSKGIDTKLDYSYQGEYLIHIPSNLYKTTSTDFKNGDVVTKYNGKDITSNEDFINYIKEDLKDVMYEGSSIIELYENNKLSTHNSDGSRNEENIKRITNIITSTYSDKSSNKFTVLRDENELEITPSRRLEILFLTHILLKSDDDGAFLYSISDFSFSKYKIDYVNASPSIDISSSSTVGPSGGLLQTLAIYNAITSEDITHGKRIMGTGGISLNGEVSAIGGEQQKIITANLYSADIFFIPNDNYESAKEMYDKLKDTNMTLVSVKTFSDALEYLEGVE